MYRLYVDDIVMIVQLLSKGVVYDIKKKVLSFKKVTDDDDHENDEACTF